MKPLTETAVPVLSHPSAVPLHSKSSRCPGAFFLLSPFILQTAVWPFVRLVSRFFLHLDIHGLEHLESVPAGSGVIFASSHSSELDSILVPASLPFLSRFSPMFYTSREWTFYKNSGWRKYLYGGFLFKIWGAHRLHSGKHDYEISLQTHIQLLDAGKSLCMFPDGRQLPEDEIGTHAHGGVGFLAWRTGALVIPVRITGIFQMGMYEFLTRKRKAVFSFGASIQPHELFPNVRQPVLTDIKTAVEKIIAAIQTL